VIYPRLGFQHALPAARFGAAVGDAIVLAVKTEDEHGTPVHVAARLVGSDFGRHITLGIDVTDALTEAASTELFGAAEKIDRVVGIVRGDAGFHGAEMLITEWKDVRPHV
jgi:class 3 adenylate cyclase